MAKISTTTIDSLLNGSDSLSDKQKLVHKGKENGKELFFIQTRQSLTKWADKTLWQVFFSYFIGKCQNRKTIKAFKRVILQTKGINFNIDKICEEYGGGALDLSAINAYKENLNSLNFHGRGFNKEAYAYRERLMQYITGGEKVKKLSPTWEYDSETGKRFEKDPETGECFEKDPKTGELVKYYPKEAKLFKFDLKTKKCFKKNLKTGKEIEYYPEKTEYLRYKPTTGECLRYNPRTEEDIKCDPKAIRFLKFDPKTRETDLVSLEINEDTELS